MVYTEKNYLQMFGFLRLTFGLLNLKAKSNGYFEKCCFSNILCILLFYLLNDKCGSAQLIFHFLVIVLVFLSLFLCLEFFWTPSLYHTIQ